jgi:hypothetical protein
MPIKKPYLKHISSGDDLVTPYEAVRVGFVSLALERNRRATPFVEQARTLKTYASQARTPTELTKIENIQSALLTAAGISEKAATHLQPDDKKEAIEGLIANFLEPSGADFVEELVFRFLLTRGDTLGGSMRNAGGALAQRKLTRTILSTLRLAGTPYRWLHSNTNKWIEMPDNDADIEMSLRGVCWKKGKKNRTIIYNITVPFLRNNVDLCLFDCVEDNLSQEIFKDPSRYIALGELKGGIDPAGADEHWKTARTALARIKQTFDAKEFSPKIFFIGAAIEKKMSGEIWQMLENGYLSNVANLTNHSQLASIVLWLCNL